MNTSKSVLEPLRLRIRRFQFTVGLGFLALILGSIVSVALSQRLVGRVQALPLGLLRFLIGLVIQNLWVLAVLPALSYGAARIIELRSVPTALGAALTGQLFLAALEFVQDGVDGWVERGGWVLSAQWSVLFLGMWLTHRAIQRGRRDAEAQAELARQKAASRKDEYAEFLREAERAGEKSAQRDAPLAEAPPTGVSGAVPASAPVPEQAPAPTSSPAEPATSGGETEPSKTPAV